MLEALFYPREQTGNHFQLSDCSVIAFTGSGYKLPLLQVRIVLAERLYHAFYFFYGRPEVPSNAWKKKEENDLIITSVDGGLPWNLLS